MTGRTLYAALLLIAVVSASTAACGDDNDEGGGPTATVVPTAPEATATSLPNEAPPAAGLSGISELDAVLAAIQSGAADGIRSLIRFSSVRCSATPQGPGSNPCGANEAEGQLIEVFPTLECELVYIRPDEIDRVIVSLTEAELYAAYRVGPEVGFSDASYAELGFPTEYVAIVFHPSTEIGRAASQVLIAEGGIVGYLASCVITPEELANQFGSEDVVLPPRTP